MLLLVVQHLAKAYGPNQVLNNVSFTLAAGQKVGLVGANGAGKSTLLKLIVGEIEADQGVARVMPGADVGYLPQVLAAAEEQTISGLIDQLLGDLRQIEARLRALEETMSTQTEDLEALLTEYSTLSETFERRGGYDLEHRLAEVFAGLGITALAPSRPMATLSGGEKARVGLAALLLRAPDLLLLDEPTNHLDFAALAWLEGYLQGSKGGILVVSHDRHFLNQTVQSIIEIDEQTKEAKQYTGNYDFYAQVKTQERNRWVAEYWAQQEEIWELRKLMKTKSHQNPFARAPRDNDKFAYTFKAEKMQSSLARNIRNAEERLRRLEEAPIPKPPRPLEINPSFDPQTLVSKTPLLVTGVSKWYGEKPVLRDVQCSVEPHSRIVLIGPNGAGKSTLLKIMAGVEEPDAGQVFSAASVVIGHLDQEQETLKTDGTLFDAYRQERIGDYEELKAELLDYGLFTWPDLRKPVAALSVGQKRKLQLARLMAQRANLLLLDEPTNHISLDVLEEFEHALQRFPGPIVAISHDRRFIERFANAIWVMDAGQLVERSVIPPTRPLF
jgi:macrolide transport system ATP-binding/permease protein